MKSYVANRLAVGNRLFPAEIKIDNFGVNLKIPGFFSGQEKSLGFHQISSVKIDSPLIGFSKITFDTIGFDRLVAEGFEKSDAIEIKELVQRGISAPRGSLSNTGNYTADPIVIQSPKTAEQINAETEQEKARHQIELEKKEQIRQSDKEFLDAIGKTFAYLFKNWKITVPVIFSILFVIVAWILFKNWMDEKNKKQSNEQIKNENIVQQPTIKSNEQTLSNSNQQKILVSDSNKNIPLKIASSKILLYQINDPDGYSNLRDNPNGNVIRKVYENERFEIIDSSNRFKKVKFSDGSTGYIHETRIKQVE